MTEVKPVDIDHALMALLQCTSSELGDYSPKLLDQYRADVTRVLESQSAQPSRECLQQSAEVDFSLEAMPPAAVAVPADALTTAMKKAVEVGIFPKYSIGEETYLRNWKAMEAVLEAAALVQAQEDARDAEYAARYRDLVSAFSASPAYDKYGEPFIRVAYSTQEQKVAWMRSVEQGSTLSETIDAARAAQENSDAS